MGVARPCYIRRELLDTLAIGQSRRHTVSAGNMRYRTLRRHRVDRGDIAHHYRVQLHAGNVRYQFARDGIRLRSRRRVRHRNRIDQIDQCIVQSCRVAQHVARRLPMYVDQDALDRQQDRHGRLRLVGKVGMGLGHAIGERAELAFEAPDAVGRLVQLGERTSQFVQQGELARMGLRRPRQARSFTMEKSAASVFDPTVRSTR